MSFVHLCSLDATNPKNEDSGTHFHTVFSCLNGVTLKILKKESLREKYKCCIHAMSAKWEGKENLVVTPSTFPKLATFVVLQVKPDTNILCLN